METCEIIGITVNANKIVYLSVYCKLCESNNEIEVESDEISPDFQEILKDFSCAKCGTRNMISIVDYLMEIGFENRMIYDSGMSLYEIIMRGNKDEYMKYFTYSSLIYSGYSHSSSIYLKNFLGSAGLVWKYLNF